MPVTQKRRYLQGVLLLLAVSLNLWVWSSPVPPDAGGAGECSCSVARQEHRWCAHCEVGYVAGQPVPSRSLFEALDAHGHDIDPTKIRCESCQKALSTDGFCDKCCFGFNGGLLYFSPLSWCVAKGTPRGVAESRPKTPSQPQSKPAKGPCSVEHVGLPKDTQFCESCGEGIVGNVVFTEAHLFDIARDELRCLRLSVARLEECEICAIAQFLRSRCRQCDHDFRCRCKVAQEQGGWCSRCEWGHWQGLRFTSKAAHARIQELWQLGSTIAPTETCKKGDCAVQHPPGAGIEGGAWCQACGHGVLGDRWFRKEADHAALVELVASGQLWPPRSRRTPVEAPPPKGQH